MHYDGAAVVPRDGAELVLVAFVRIAMIRIMLRRLAANASS